MNTNQLLKKLFQEIYLITNPECGQCNAPYSCCSKEYCNIALQFAKEEWNVDLANLYMANERVPFLKENRCQVEPHLRPLCTLHTCNIFKSGILKDPDKNKKYWRLRKIIEYLWTRRNEKEEKKNVLG